MCVRAFSFAALQPYRGVSFQKSVFLRISGLPGDFDEAILCFLLVVLNQVPIYLLFKGMLYYYEAPEMF